MNNKKAKALRKLATLVEPSYKQLKKQYKKLSNPNPSITKTTQNERIN